MNMPPIPPPTIVDNRRLYAAGDMREYGETCATYRMVEIDKSRMKNNASGQPTNDSVEFLRGMMGMK